MLDDESHIALMNNFLVANGLKAIMFFYQILPPPSIKSGRLDLSNRYAKVVRAVCTDGLCYELTGKCVACYRINNKKSISMENAGEDLSFVSFNVEDGESPLKGMYKVLMNVTNQVLCTNSDRGVCNTIQIVSFFHGYDTFLKFLAATDSDLDNRVFFDVSHELYKGHLLVPYQIKETSIRPNLVYEVEKSFRRWMRKTEIALLQGRQIRRDPVDVGPLQEKLFWQGLLTKYTSIVEFVASKPFANHFACLIMSRSKLVPVSINSISEVILWSIFT